MGRGLVLGHAPPDGPLAGLADVAQDAANVHGSEAGPGEAARVARRAARVPGPRCWPEHPRVVTPGMTDARVHQRPLTPTPR
jgi:hypothetical protein